MHRVITMHARHRETYTVLQDPQLRVGRRPCKGPRVDTKILKTIYMNFELSNYVSE